MVSTRCDAAPAIARPAQVPGPPPTARRSAPATPRTVVQALLVAVLVGLGLPLLSGAPVDADAGATGPGVVVSVRPGETVWEIAEAHADSPAEVRELVAAIRRANGLDGRPPAAWQRLRVPDLP